jgi:thioredoxin-related protein
LAKPVVDGIERDLEGQARVVRLSVLTGVGNELARRYGVQGVPTIMIFDGQGRLVDQQTGIPGRQSIVEQVNTLLTH